MIKTTVVNIRYDPNGDWVYIGRAGRGYDGYFGNPFPLMGKREEILELYRTWFLRRVETDPEFRKKVLALRGKKLGCFCIPLLCHGTVMAEWIDAQFTEAA